jgi:hypothetical protein
MDKKIAIVTQTYNDNRGLLFHYHSSDTYDINFRNSFDFNLYSFHNVNDEMKIKKYEYFNKINNLTFLSQKNLSYPQTFKNILNYLVELGFNYLIFLQDDTFTVNTKYISELIDFIKFNNFDMLNIFYRIDEFTKNTTHEIFFENGDFRVYNTTTFDFKNNNLFSFDDSAYVSKIDFLINQVYDEIYFSHNDIWSAERYLNEKFKNKNIQRLVTNFSLYRNFNIIGVNTWNKEYALKELEKMFK